MRTLALALIGSALVANAVRAVAAEGAAEFELFESVCVRQFDNIDDALQRMKGPDGWKLLSSASPDFKARGWLDEILATRDEKQFISVQRVGSGQSCSTSIKGEDLSKIDPLARRLELVRDRAGEDRVNGTSGRNSQVYSPLNASESQMAKRLIVSLLVNSRTKENSVELKYTNIRLHD